MNTPIAIIGIGCRLPGGADSPNALWDLLRTGRCTIAPVPADRWNADAFFDPDPAAPGKTTSRHGAFLEQVDQFDPAFFGISADEARAMDPQQRLMLEVAWEALEDAAVAPDAIAGTDAAVIVGVSTYNYATLAYDQPAAINAHTNTGSGGSVIANRISYFLDLRGPSYAVDAACASSLLAVHLACQSIWSGEATLALAGGVNVILAPGPGIGLCKAGLTSPDGQCRPFDANAAGAARGEGAAVVVLKPLPQALADNDPIYAVIRGSGLAQNGRSNGLTGPSRWGQEAALRAALRQAAVNPADVDYVETQSIGTLLGDATELTALATALGVNRPADRPLVVGSLKPNLGHLEAAAGVVGLIKVALMLRHRRHAPTLHFQAMNPYAPKGAALRVVTADEPWPARGGHPLVAGVSATGYAGSNVHVVLASADDAVEPAPSADPQVLRLSARDPTALRDLAARYAAYITERPATDLATLCRSAHAGRARLPHRLAIIATNLPQLGERLATFLAGAADENVLIGQAPRARKRVTTADPNQSPADLARAFITGADDGMPSPGPRLHNLPTYPFQRQRYWLPDAPKTPNDSSWHGHVPMPVSASPASALTGRMLAAQIHAPSPSLPATQPTTETERRLAAIWQRVLNIDSIDTQASFFDLGGTSFAALELFIKVEEEFGLALPVASLLSSANVEQMAKLIDETAQADPGVAIRARWETVVTFNRTGARPPLFFVPGLGGHAFDLRMLAEQIGPDQPIHILHPHGLDPATTPLATVEDIAAAFVDHVRRIQPHGPYRLGGYSFGGSVAYELAVRLTAAGESIHTLLLIDAIAPGAFRPRPLPRRLLAHARRVIDVRNGGLTFFRKRVDRLWARMTGAALGPAATPPPDRPLSATAMAVRRLTAANKRAWFAYQPPRYAGPALLFRAAIADHDMSDFADQHPSNGWSDFAAPNLEVFELTCDHLDIFKGDNLHRLADRIRRALAPPAAYAEDRPTEVAAALSR